MTKFAAYDDFSIYAVADTADRAIENARCEAGDQEAQFSTAQVTDDLASQIDRDGWNGHRQSFRVDGGFIIETTNE